MEMRLAASDASMALSLCTAGLVTRSTRAQSTVPGVANASVGETPTPERRGLDPAGDVKNVPGVAASRVNASRSSGEPGSRAGAEEAAAAASLSEEAAAASSLSEAVSYTHLTLPTKA